MLGRIVRVDRVDNNGVVRVPASIVADDATDVTDHLLSFIGDTPDHTTIDFRGDTFRVDGTLRVDDRNGLTVRNGAIQAVTAGDSARRHWHIVGGSSWRFEDFTVRGAAPDAGSGLGQYNANYAFQHAWSIHGVQGFQGHRISAHNCYGDAMWLGGNTPCRDIKVTNFDFRGLGRQGIAPVNVSGALFGWGSFFGIGRTMIDLEPSISSYVIEDVTIVGCTTGRGTLRWLSGSASQGQIVRRINVLGNRAHIPSAINLDPEGSERWGPVLVEGNQFWADGAGSAESPASAMAFKRCDNVTFRHNEIWFLQPAREMIGVLFDDCHNATVEFNRFVGAGSAYSGINGSTFLATVPNYLA